MQRDVIVILLENDKKKQHLLYKVVDYHSNGVELVYYVEKNDNTLILGNREVERDRVYSGYKVKGIVKLRVDTDELRTHRLYLLNCISTGKVLTGIKGIFFNCQQFYNKAKELSYGKK